MMHSARVNSDGVEFSVILINVNSLLSVSSIQTAKDFCLLQGIELEVRSFTTELHYSFSFSYNITSFARILLMDEMIEDFFWFDSDLILLPGWTSIVEHCMSNPLVNQNVISAVLDSASTLTRLSESSHRAYLECQGSYFNSGVLYVESKKWKELRRTRDWIAIFEELKVEQSQFLDQDLLNIFLRGRINLIPGRYNFIVSDKYVPPQVVSILHFAGGPKPWKLTPNLRNLFLSTASINLFGNNVVISRVAHSLKWFFLYWDYEDALIEYIRNENPVLLISTLKSRDIGFYTENFRERMKVKLLRLMSRDFI